MSMSSIKMHSTTGPALEAASPMLSNQLKMEHQAEILAMQNKMKLNEDNSSHERDKLLAKIKELKSEIVTLKNT